MCWPPAFKVQSFVTIFTDTCTHFLERGNETLNYIGLPLFKLFVCVSTWLFASLFSNVDFWLYGVNMEL